MSGPSRTVCAHLAPIAVQNARLITRSISNNYTSSDCLSSLELGAPTKMMTRLTLAAAILATVLASATTAKAQQRCINEPLENTFVRGNLDAENCTMTNVQVSGRIRFFGPNNTADNVRAGGNIRIMARARLTAVDIHSSRDILSTSASDISLTSCTSGGNIEINRTDSSRDGVFVDNCIAGGNLELKDSTFTLSARATIQNSRALRGQIRVVSNRSRMSTLIRLLNLSTSGNLTVMNNNLTTGSSIFIQGIRIGGRLDCSGNALNPANGGNNIAGRGSTGECRRFGL